MYEMLAGRLPFEGTTAHALMLAVASQTPAPITDVRSDVPKPLARLVHSALERNVAQRTITADDIARETARLLTTETGSSSVTAAPRAARRTAMAVAAVGILTALLAGAWLVQQNTRARWAREQALPQVEQLAEREDYLGAFRLANDARRIIPNDPVWRRIDPIVSRTITVRATPEGTAVSYRPVGSNGEWTELGPAPIVSAVVPTAYLEWQFEKAGYVTASDTTAFGLGPGLVPLPMLVNLQDG